jgi:hypothetical protein
MHYHQFGTGNEDRVLGVILDIPNNFAEPVGGIFRHHANDLDVMVQQVMNPQCQIATWPCKGQKSRAV